VVKSPSIAECQLAFECTLVKIDDPGAMTEVIWGKVVAAHVSEALADLEEDAFLTALDPIYNYSFGPRDGTYHRIGDKLSVEAD
jgi:flavin reductase (DIM6/NTAB) family NADH-FMN oxidoreductase RutF